MLHEVIHVENEKSQQPKESDTIELFVYKLLRERKMRRIRRWRRNKVELVINYF